ncbi:MAG TPA: hypothetical protein VKA46_23430, partial [Gemmataceae bacterium]|nr:hypothetical protein [Gemmataceae bacterium]
MWPTLITLCLALSGNASRRAAPRRRHAFRCPLGRRPVPRRLWVEVLEDRTLLSPYLVTTTADSGAGSLRDAITQVNADISHALYASPSNPSVDEIDFTITAASDTGGGYNSATGVATITPLSALPVITNAVLIDGYTQAGAKPNDLSGPGPLGQAPGAPSTYGDDALLKIELDGANAGNATGLWLD